MPTQATISVTPGTGLFLDAISLFIGSNTVLREITTIGDPSNATYLATVNSAGALNVADAPLDACITANVLAVSLPTAQITTLTPPTAAAIAAAIVANPPTITATVSGSIGVTQVTNPWIISGAVTGTFWQIRQPVSLASGQVASGAFASGSIASGAIASGAIAAGAAAAGAFADGSIFARSNAAATFPVTAYLNDGSGNAITSDSRGSARPLAVEILDASGNQITTFGSSSVTAAQGTAAALSAYWPVGLSDGTNLIGVSAHPLYVQGAVTTSGTATVIGTFTNNNAAPAATNVGALVAIANAVSPTYTEGKQVLLSTDLDGHLRAHLFSTDTYSGTSMWPASIRPTGSIEVVSDNSVIGDFIVSSKRSQFDINFSTGDATDASLLTITTSGSGANTQANGGSIFATGTAAAGQATAVTVSKVTYRAATDVFSDFTAAFTIPTDATAAHDYQRIGFYDTNNGLFVGYEGTSFGVTKRLATVDTRVTAATTAGVITSSSFNLDPLDGSAGSKFTRIGVPEALNTTFLNLYRIRLSWHGAAIMVFDIYSPDGDWIPFHVIRYPNTASIPSLAAINLPMTVDVFKTTSDSTNLKITTGSWAAGVSEAAIRMTDAIVDSTLAIPTRSVLVGHTTAGGGSYVNVKVNPSGALTTASSGTDADNATNSTSKLPVIAAVANAAAPSWTEAHEAPLSADLQGSVRVRPGSPNTANWSQAAINISTSGASTIGPTATGSQTVRIMRMFFVNSDPVNATNITLQDTTVTAFSGAFRLITGGSFNGTDANGEPLFVTAAGKSFQINSSVAVQLSGTVWYTIS